MESAFNQHQAANEILNDLFGGSNNIHKSEEEFSQSPPTKPPVEVRQLFIKNLPYRVRWQDIKDLFRKAGHVVRADVALGFDNRSKGHGTVLFTSKEDAQKAIDMFNGYKWNGRILEIRGDRGFVENMKDEHEETVVTQEAEVGVEIQAKAILEEKEKKADTKIEHKEEKIHVQNEPEDEEDDCKQVFVGNLPFHCSWHDLKTLFKSCGRVVRADVVLNFEGRSRGFGTVLYHSHQDAKSAIETYNGFEFHHRVLRVHFDKFALNHQRLREEEEESFGQRQIHDPASVELLRQTYSLPTTQPKTTQQLYGLSSYMPPPFPIQQMNYPTTTNAYCDKGYQNHPPYITHTYMTHNTNYTPYQTQPQPLSFTGSTNPSAINGNYTNGYLTTGQRMQQSYQPTVPSPYNHTPYPQQQQYVENTRNDISSYLSGSFNSLNLSTTQGISLSTNQEHQSAGLMNSNNKWV